MLPKVAALALFVTSVVAGVLPDGYYRIDASYGAGPVRAYQAGDPIKVYNGPSAPPPFQTWYLQNDDASNGYTIYNIGTSSFAGVFNEIEGVAVFAGPRTIFDIQPAGEGTYTIKIPNKDLLWYIVYLEVDGPGLPIGLYRANGSPEQRWEFTRL